MGVTKTDSFSEQQNEIAALAKALGHPARIAILEYILSQDSCIVKSIVDEIPLSQATISQHLKELKNAEFIIGSIEGTSVCYCVNPLIIEKLMKYLGDFGQQIIDRTSCC